MRTHRPTTAMLGTAVLTALLLAAGACSGDDDDVEAGGDAGGDDTTETTSGEAEDATVFAIEDGDCLASDPSVQGGEVSEVPKVDCEEPHFTEVFHTYTIDAGELPSGAEMEGIVQDQCVAEFESFVGMPYDQSALEITWLEPTPESWERGDRELVCMITDPAGETTGSLEGANR
jgi:Septum formation